MSFVSQTSVFANSLASRAEVSNGPWHTWLQALRAFARCDLATVADLLSAGGGLPDAEAAS